MARRSTYITARAQIYDITSSLTWPPNDRTTLESTLTMATLVPNGSSSVRSTYSDRDRDEDATRKQIRQLRGKEGNNVCADCGAAGQFVHEYLLYYWLE